MKKVLTAIGNPMLNNKFKDIKNCNLLDNDIETDEKLIECLEREEEVDILFLCSNIIQNYTTQEFIEIIRKIQENIFIVFFKGENIQSSVKEDNKLKIYNALDLDLKIFEKIFKKQMNKSIVKNNSKTIAISGANGVRKEYVFHISCKKCGKPECKNAFNRF